MNINVNPTMHHFATPNLPPSKDPSNFISPTSVFPQDHNNNHHSALLTEHSILNLPPNRTHHSADVAMTQCILSDEMLVAPPVPSKNSNTNANSNTRSDTMLISDALEYVLQNEGRTFHTLESYAISNALSPCAETPSQRLVRALITGRSSSNFNDAVRKIETCLGKWVVHNYTYSSVPYRPADMEGCVTHNISSISITTNNSNSNALFDAWMTNISDWAKAEKIRYKEVLDARKDALDGILGLERARLVNNQKSAHLSKFQSNLIEDGKTNLIKWLVDDKYSALINVAFFKERIDK